MFTDNLLVNTIKGYVGLKAYQYFVNWYEKLFRAVSSNKQHMWPVALQVREGHVK